MPIPGERVQTFAHVIHPDGSPDTGLTVLFDLYEGPDGEMDSARLTWEELTEGFYGIYYQTLVTDSYGDYEIHFHVNNFIDAVPENSEFNHNWTLFQTTPMAPGLGGSMGVPRREIRPAVARMLNDFAEGTSDGAGGTTWIKDPINFRRETNWFKGMQILFTNADSPNFGRIATVTSSDSLTQIINFEPPLPIPVLPGDTVELYNFRSRGTTVSQYNASINDAIAVARQEHALLPISYTFDTGFARTSPYITVPSTFTSFYAMETTDSAGYVYRVRPQDMIVDRMTRRIEVRTSRAIDRLHGRYMVLHGYAEPALLFNDDDRTLIPLDWLYSEVKAQILERMVLNDNPVSSQDRIYLQERTEANGKRPIVVTQMMPNTYRLY